MSDFYEFNEKKHSRRMTLSNLIVVGLVCLLIGAIGMYFILPLFGGEQPAGNLDNSPTPSVTATATPSPSPTPEAEDDSPILGSRGDVYISGENPVVEINQKVGPAVVGITNTSTVTTHDWWGQEVTKTVPATGSGIIISEEGYIVTNYHVVQNADTLEVVINGGDPIPAEPVGVDPINDVAVIKIDPKGLDLTVASIGDSDKVQVGELAVAIGNPLGYDLAGSVTAGIISGVDRTVTVDSREMTLLQTDAAINPGNSGGALVNAQGEVIGMNTMKDTGTAVEGLGFAIPSNTFISVAQDLIENGSVERAGMGVTVEDISQEIQDQYGVPAGVHVLGVTEDGAAAKAGIRINDVIMSLDGVDTPDCDTLLVEIEKHNVGDTIPVKIWRSGHESTVNVTLQAIAWQ